MKRLFTALAVALLLVLTASAQVAVFPMPNAKPQFFTNGGVPCAACTLTTYAGGTTTPLATYTDSTGTVTNPTTMTLNSAGYPVNQLWLGPFSYKFVLKDALGSTIWTVDNVSSLTAIPYARTDKLNTFTVSQTFSAGGIFSAIDTTGANTWTHTHAFNAGMTTTTLSASTGVTGSGAVVATLGLATIVGTSPGAPGCTASHVCNQVNGTLTFLSGTGMTVAGDILKVTFPATRTNVPDCAVNAYDVTTGAPLAVIQDQGTSTTSFMWIFSLTTLTASHIYNFTYVCGAA